MNAAVTAALVAAQQSGAMPDVVGRLTAAGAISIDKAVAFEARTNAEAKQRDEMIGQGLVRRRGDGRLYVNQRAVEERNARMGAQFLVGALIGLSILASAVALLVFTR